MRPTASASNVVLACALALAACQFTENDQELETPPVLLRFTVPADSATNMYDADGLDFVARFRTEFPSQRVTTCRLIPPPLSRGDIDFSVPRQIVIPDVVLNPAVPVHLWLIDGPDFVEPVVVNLYPGEDVVTDGYLHANVTRGRSREEATDALVFVLAYDVPDTLVPANARTMLGLPVVTVRPVVDRPEFIANLYVNNLWSGARYVMIAIADTDGDGRYEPREDWWGYPRDPFLVNRIEWTRAGSLGDLTTSLPKVPISIVPPGELNPPDFLGPARADAGAWTGPVEGP